MRTVQIRGGQTQRTTFGERELRMETTKKERKGDFAAYWEIQDQEDDDKELEELSSVE